MQQVLTSNQDISNRLANMELHSLGTARSSITSTAQSYQEIDDDSSTIRPKKNVPNKLKKSRMIRFGDLDNEQGLIKGFGFTFNRELKASRVYKRGQSRRPETSCSSSIAPSMGWSFLSGLSLADISNISTLSLPISPSESWNSQYYGFDTGSRPELEEVPSSPTPAEHSSEAGFPQLARPTSHRRPNRRDWLVELDQREVSLSN